MTTVREWPAGVGNPGSSHAQQLGCSCSPVLNYFGRGDTNGGYQIAPGCHVHARFLVPVDGIRCDNCGEVLEVIGDKTPRTACPNGCTDKQIGHPTAQPRAGRLEEPRGFGPFAGSRATQSLPERVEPLPQWRLCERCDKPIIEAKRRGRPRRVHAECLTEAESKARARTRTVRDRDAESIDPLEESAS
jgi:hypothetical protein